jgi:hypothetical protein
VTEFLSGLWQKRYYVRQPIIPVSPRLACITDHHYDSSAIIEDLLLFLISKTLENKTPVLSSLPSWSSSANNLPLSATSFSSSTQHQHGSQQPGGRGLMLCLEEMLKVSREEHIYVIVDVLDECPATYGLQPSREKISWGYGLGPNSRIYDSASQVTPRSTSGTFLNL